MEDLQIEGRRIGSGHRPFLIAEMSGNHNQSLQRALAIVDAAAEAGADALKIQTYTADTMTLNVTSDEFRIHDEESLWKGHSLYELYQQAYTPWEWHQPILERCREHGLIGFSTPFDATSVDFLESLQVSVYKIASFENTDIPLIQKVASTGKPMIISTGMASAAELDETVRAAREAGCQDLILLKCTSAYPASPLHSHLLTLPHMRDLFRCQVGLSDHTPGFGAAVASVALGARVLEKHLTLDRREGGVDAAFSLEPNEFKTLVTETTRAWQALGAIHYGTTGIEEKSLQFRRSLYISISMKSGDILDKNNVRIVRPGLGLPPKYYPVILGRRVNRDVAAGTPLHWNLIG